MYEVGKSLGPRDKWPYLDDILYIADYKYSARVQDPNFHENCACEGYTVNFLKMVVHSHLFWGK